MIRLEDITPDNWRLGLRVSEAQRRYVSDSAGILARAYAYRENRSRAFVIDNDGVPVGMGLYYDLPEMACYDFSQFFIDERYQGRGFGPAAARLILEELRRDGRYDKVVLCYVEGNDRVRRFYEGFGFTVVDRDEDEMIMELRL